MKESMFDYRYEEGRFSYIVVGRRMRGNDKY